MMSDVMRMMIQEMQMWMRMRMRDDGDNES